jgi:hypothetical protein
VQIAERHYVNVVRGIPKERAHGVPHLGHVRSCERKLHRLADGALPPDELAVLDELLPRRRDTKRTFAGSSQAQRDRIPFDD